METKRSEERAAIRRLLMYWGNVLNARREKGERIAQINQEIDGLYDVRPASVTGQPRASEPGNPTQAAAIRNEKKVAALEANKARLQEEIENMDWRAGMIEYEVMCLPPLESEVIRLRYTKYGVAKKGYWQKIARKVHVSESHAKKLEAMGVDKLCAQIKVDTIRYD